MEKLAGGPGVVFVVALAVDDCAVDELLLSSVGDVESLDTRSLEISTVLVRCGPGLDSPAQTRIWSFLKSVGDSSGKFLFSISII